MCVTIAYLKYGIVSTKRFNMSEWEDFQETVLKAVLSGRIQELAREFQVADSTVMRWANGIARPIPALRNKISEYINK